MIKRKFMALFELSFRFNLKTSIADLLELATSTVSTQVNNMLKAIKEEERINKAWEVSTVVSRKIDTIAEEDEEKEEEQEGGEIIS